MEIEVCGTASYFGGCEFLIGQDVFSFQRELVFVKCFSHELPRVNFTSAPIKI
jgi:hypothetical protein